MLGPPPPMGAPPPPSIPVFSSGKSGAGDGRNQLLQSIRQGSTLKKTVTVDKSSPLISGKSTNVESSAGSGEGGTIGNGIGARRPNGGGPVDLSRLFAGGMPKLKPTGLEIVAAQTSSSNVAKPSLNTQLFQERSPTKSQVLSPQPDKKSYIAPKPTAHNSIYKTLPNPKKRTEAHKSQQIHQQPNASTVPQPLSQHLKNIEQSRFTANVHPNESPVVVVKHKFSPLNNTKKSQLSNQTLGGGSKLHQQGSIRPQDANAFNRTPPPQSQPSQSFLLRTNLTQPPEEFATCPTITRRITILHNQPKKIVVRNAVPNTSSLHKNSFKFGAPTPLKIFKPSPWTTSLNQNSNYGGSMPSLVQSTPKSIAVTKSEPHLSDSDPKIIHRKPNVAPKPPGILPINGGSFAHMPKILYANGRPLSRAQRFKLTRSPPATPNPEDSMSFGMMINNGYCTLRPNNISHPQKINKFPLPIIPKTSTLQPLPDVRCWNKLQ